MARILLPLREGDNEYIHHLTNMDIASILGITKETVSRVLASFKLQGILMMDGGSCVAGCIRADIPALKIIATDV
jgi:CRP-like cAMP-binding protein